MDGGRRTYVDRWVAVSALGPASNSVPSRWRSSTTAWTSTAVSRHCPAGGSATLQESRRSADRFYRSLSRENERTLLARAARPAAVRLLALAGG